MKSALDNKGSATPAFAAPLRLGQHNMPSRDRFEAAMRDIFERRYYTNQGPLARAFEERLQSRLAARHVVCVTNVTIGLMMAGEALGMASPVLVPRVCTSALTHALNWCGVSTLSVEPDAASGQLDVSACAKRVGRVGGVGAIVGANLWGGACDAAALASLARAHDLPLMFDSSEAFGITVAGQRAGQGGALEVFSFDAADIVNAGGGACVATDDDELAARLRNIRSSYGAGRPVSVVKTSNGRMSEAQAALGLMSLDDFDANRERNRASFEAYRAGLSGLAGIRLVVPSGVDASNHQTVVCAFDEDAAGCSRDALIAALASHDIEARGIASSWLRLPIGAHVDIAAVGRVCEAIGAALAAGATHEGAAA